MREHGNAGVQRVDNTEERLRDGVMNVTCNAVTLGFDGKASGAVNAQDGGTKCQRGLIRTVIRVLSRSLVSPDSSTSKMPTGCSLK